MRGYDQPVMNKFKYKKAAALFFLVLMLIQVFPVQSKTLANPNRPHIEVSDWVDIFTGDLNYSISLLDVPASGGSYPISLNYKSGDYTDMSSEWVGLGWELSVGSIKRNVVGVADEFAGDSIKAMYDIEPSVTVGAGAGVGEDVLGKQRIFKQDDYLINHLNFYQHSKYGLGYSLDKNAGYHQVVSSEETQFLQATFPDDSLHESCFPSLALTAHVMHPCLHAPELPVAIQNTTYSSTHKIGNAWGGAFSYGYVTGYYNRQTVKYNNEWKEYPAFGAFYTQQPLQPESVTDAIRQPSPEVSRTSDLPVTRLQCDKFILQEDGKRVDLKVTPLSYVVLPQSVHQITTMAKGNGKDNAVVDHKGSNNFLLTGSYYSGPWRGDQTVGQGLQEIIKSKSTLSLESVENRVATRYSAHKGLMKDPFHLSLNGKGKDVQAELDSNELKRSFSDFGFHTREKSQPTQIFTNQDVLNSEGRELLPELKILYRDIKGDENIFRRDQFPKHHWAAITTIKTDGNRYTYGLPSYVVNREEVVFSGLREGETSFVTTEQGADEIPQYRYSEVSPFLSYVKTPQYAESFLLTSIVGADYVDVGNDGITEDDLGYWVKFGYKKATTPEDFYKQRVPFIKANLIEGSSSKTDDKGAYTYSEKELWYLDQIETSSHIVQFITDERLDGYGAAQKIQNEPLLGKARRVLKEIRMYSKELDEDQPVQIVKMEYDYSLYRGAVDSKLGNGKLTLKKLWFEGYDTARGQNNPFKFNYIGENTVRTSLPDKWKTSGISEERQEAQDEMIAYGSLKSLITPSGKIVNIQYEPDDYAYVQHLEAQQLTPLVSDGPISDQNLKVIFKLESAVATNLSDEEKRKIVMRYLGSQKEIGFKLHVNLLAQDSKEFQYVAGKAGVDFSKPMGLENEEDGNVLGYFYLLPEKGKHPFSVSAWNYLLKKAPQLMGQPGKLEETNDRVKQKKQIERLIAASGQIRKVYQNFFEHCDSMGWGRELNARYSAIRLNSPDKIKQGRGFRVKQITMIDQFSDHEMDVTGYWLDYTKEENGQLISSGVAENEFSPDENPLIDKFPQWAHVYPSAEVGYSRVNIYTLASAMLAGKPIQESSYFPQGEEVTFGTKGMSIYEFYTAQDFPTIISATTRDNKSYAVDDQSGSSIHQLASCQGYSVLNNDMHGQVKKVSSYRQYSSGKFEQVPCAWESYDYFSKPFFYDGKLVSVLINDFAEDEEGFLDPYGEYYSYTLGQYDQRFIDLREVAGETWHIGQQVNINDMSMSLLSSSPLSIHLKSASSKVQHATTVFKTAVSHRFLNQHGIVRKRLSSLNGRVEVIDYLKFDKATSHPILFSKGDGQKICSFEYLIPAYNRYIGMGPASFNLGYSYSIYDVEEMHDSFYTFKTSAMKLQPGDELIVYSSDDHKLALTKATVLGEQSGIYKLSSLGKLKEREYEIKVVRSGFRNQLDALVGRISTTSKPLWRQVSATNSKTFIIPK